MTPLRIYLLGIPRFEREDQSIHISRKKSVALLAYLGATALPHSRDALATMLWPENDQSGARANLRRELSRIKSALGGVPLAIEREQVAINQTMGWWLDVAAFQTKLTESQKSLLNQSDTIGESEKTVYVDEIKDAVALYRGEFMAGFSLPDCPQFDEWQFFQREQFSRSLMEAFEHLVYWHISRHDYQNAIEYARQLLALDNLSEPAHRQLMRLYDWSGQQGAAIRQYEQCVRILEKEIGVEPEDETLALYEAIKSRQLAPPDLEELRQEVPWISADGELEQHAFFQDVGTTPEVEQADTKQHASSVELAVMSTPFIGREKEQERLAELLIENSQSRLVSLVGPGGVGKTRLALEIVPLVQDAFPDDVFIIPLASLSSPDQILFSIAEKIGFRFHAASGQKQQLIDYLHQKQILLVMDNFEHVMLGTSLVIELLQSVPELKILVTSRERLNLVDEVVISLSGMEYPLEGPGDPSGKDLSEYESVQLLVQSARRVQPGFELQPGDMDAAGQLTSLMEGLPLGIILAANWLEMLSPGEIVAEISQSLDFLESLAQDIPERQRSLRAVFKASWSSLTDAEREALERLSVFQGSFSRQAALAVTKTTLSTLLALIQKSWLQRNQDGRFQIHELQRQYISEKLQEKPMAWDRARDEHCTYYALRLSELNQAMRDARQDEAFNEIALEFDNLQIAWNWASEKMNFEALVHQMLLPIYRFCEVRLKSNELLQLVAVALPALEQRADLPGYLNYHNILLTVQASFYVKGDSVRLDRYDLLIPPIYEENIHRVGDHLETFEDLEVMGIWGVLFAYLYGRFVDSQQGQIHLRQLAEGIRKQDQQWELALVLQMLGSLNLFISLSAAEKDPILEEAGRCLTQALAIFEKLGDPREYSYSLLWLGGYHANRNQYDKAISIWTQAQAQFDQLGDTFSSIHWLLGEMFIKTGDYQAAFQYYHNISEQYIQKGQKRVAAYALSLESIHALRYSTIEHARETREQSLRLSQDVQDTFGEAWSIWEMGEINRLAGDHESARLNYDQAKEMFAQVKDNNGEIFYLRGQADLALDSGDEEGAFPLFEQSYNLAREANFIWGAVYSLAGMGRAAVVLNKFKSAQEHLSEALRMVSTIGDLGLALVVLANCASFYAACGENEPAVDLCRLVAGNYGTWKETQSQVNQLLDRLIDAATTPKKTLPRQDDIWDVVQGLLEADFQPD
jgi:predicted ATPase/DNA-binding SARP family transcriptional activator